LTRVSTNYRFGKRSCPACRRTSSGVAVPVPAFMMVIDATRFPKRAASIGSRVRLRASDAPR